MQYEMRPIEDVVPFLFPCQGCGSLQFQMVCIQPYGVALSLPFMRHKALASTHKAYQIVCVDCFTVNGRLQKQDVEQLERGVLPSRVVDIDPLIREVYTPGYLDSEDNQIYASIDEDDRPEMRRQIEHYRFP